LKASLTSPTLALVFVVAFLQAMSLPVFAKCLAYFATYVAGDPAWVGTALLAMTLAQAGAMPIWIYATRRVSSSAALLAAYGVSGLGLLAFALSAGGLGASTTASLVLVGVGVGGANMALWALLPEAISRSSAGAQAGAKVEALPTGFFLLAIKCGIGLGAGALGLALDLGGLDDAQASDPTFGGYIVLLMVIVPIIGLAIAGGLAFFAGRYAWGSPPPLSRAL
jgi:GPH family glycoside/pentoside/hexuronide:cation symporter